VKYLLIGLGGFLGANARALVAEWAARRFGTAFPYGTFIANISGSFLLGVVMVVLTHRDLLQSPYRLFFAVGFLGAYTTFSTYTYESLGLLQDGNFLLAFVKLFGSVAIGLLGVFLGIALGRGILGS
jgi:CrcB protein